MQTIKALLGFPNGTPIDAVQGKIEAVYEYKTINTAYGEKTVQNGFLVDATGAKIKFKVWEHPDLNKIKGQEVVIHASSQGKGVKVSHESYNGRGGPKTDILLDVGKMGQFQTVAVYRENKGLPAASEAKEGAAATQAPQATGSGQESPRKAIHGATAGLATNKAVDAILASGQFYELARQGKLADEIVSIGGQIAKGALRIESGELEAKTDKPKEDVPF